MLNLLKASTLVGAIALLSACGQNSMSDAFSNISLSNIDENGNAVVELKTEVGGDKLVFSNTSLPITDPKTGKNYGSVKMERTADNKNMLTISANVTGISLGNVLPDNKLPNGSDVPVAGLAKLAAVPAGTNSRIYIGTTTAGDTLVLGAAIAIKEFDGLAEYIPGATSFYSLSQNAGAKGLGGFFTSAESGKNGIALFVETNIPSHGLPIPGTASKMAGTTSSVRFIERAPTTVQSNYFGYFLSRFSQKKTPLKIK